MFSEATVQLEKIAFMLQFNAEKIRRKRFDWNKNKG